MIVGFVGLGLIGGSIAMALSGFEKAQIFGIDRNEQTRTQAIARGTVSAAYADAKDAPIEEADVIFLCLHPEACVSFVETHAHRLKPGAVLTDVCGVKKTLVEAVDAYLPEGTAFIGGHPMAGRECGGFENATGALFRGAHYIIVPTKRTTPEAYDLLRRMTAYMNCEDVIEADAQTHDARIAYTSQMMHVLALAICDQEQLLPSKGFEGGSFRAATRVAALDAKLWTELFWANRDALKAQTLELIEKLSEYAQLLGGEREALYERLTQSANRKHEYNRL